jgi:uncharacterized protein (TIGR02246 family)
MATATGKAPNEAQIRELIDAWAKAVRAQNVNGMLSHYAPDVLSFDAVAQLQLVGLDAVRKRAEEWVSSFQAPIGYEMRDLRITAGDDMAFSHSLNRVSGAMTNGKKVDMWVRATVCFHKTGGKWLVTHEHISVPFDVESSKAALELKP